MPQPTSGLPSDPMGLSGHGFDTIPICMHRRSYCFIPSPFALPQENSLILRYCLFPRQLLEYCLLLSRRTHLSIAGVSWKPGFPDAPESLNATSQSWGKLKNQFGVRSASACIRLRFLLKSFFTSVCDYCLLAKKVFGRRHLRKEACYTKNSSNW